MNEVRRPELLAPAGSPDVMKACYSAGADAVYMGLNLFSARAYAANTGEKEYIEAIRYAHLRGKKLYLTLNTLMKEKELQEMTAPLIRPLYLAGLDAVIVQDTGLLSYLSEMFPELPLHLSTQLSVSSKDSIRFLENRLPVSQIVPARELSLKELRTMAEGTDTPLECFIHGALCYSYSGQCLMSSLYGGRSGNRGRCAQPCRLSYTASYGGKGSPETSLLSMKDLNTLRILPDLIEAGIRSFKIEGRMKSAEYAAGVTSIYRKYIDLYMEKGREGYRIDPEDERKLLSLFRRRGYTDGFYRRHNGKEMISAAPEKEREDEAFLDRIRERFIDCECRVPLKIRCSAFSGKPLEIELSAMVRGKEIRVTRVASDTVEQAKFHPLPKDTLKKQLEKLGNTAFYAEETEILSGPDIFLPISRLNEERRAATLMLEEAIHQRYERSEELMKDELRKDPLKNDTKEEKLSLREDENKSGFCLSALVRTEEQLQAAVQAPGLSRVLIESTLGTPEEWRMVTEELHGRGKEAFLAFPEIFRENARSFFEAHEKELFQAGFDGFLVRNFETAGFLEEKGNQLPLISGERLYAFNSRSRDFLKDCGFSHLTIPSELNAHEILDAGLLHEELTVYGRQTLMISANCLKKTAFRCDHTPGIVTLKDRKNVRMPVLTECRFCYNLILNAEPLLLLTEEERIRTLCPSMLRLSFTTEDEGETREVIRQFTDVFLKGERPGLTEMNGYTRGHFRRGVE